MVGYIPLVVPVMINYVSDYTRSSIWNAEGITRLPWCLYPQIPRGVHPASNTYSHRYIVPAYFLCKSVAYFDVVKGFNWSVDEVAHSTCLNRLLSLIISPSKLTEVVTVQTCIHKVTSLNLCPDWNSMVFLISSKWNPGQCFEIVHHRFIRNPLQFAESDYHLV